MLQITAEAFWEKDQVIVAQQRHISAYFLIQLLLQPDPCLPKETEKKKIAAAFYGTGSITHMQTA